MEAKLIIFGVLLTIVSGKVVRFQNCAQGSKAGTPSELSVEPCNESPCILHKGSNATIKIVFKAGESVTKLEARVHGKIGFAPFLPFPLQNPDACKDSGLTCPMKGGVVGQYVQTLPIKSLYPSVSVVIKWELVDQNSNDVVCIEFPAKLE